MERRTERWMDEALRVIQIPPLPNFVAVGDKKSIIEKLHCTRTILFSRYPIESITLSDRTRRFCPLEAKKVHELLKPAKESKQGALNKHGNYTTWFPAAPSVNTHDILMKKCEDLEVFLLILIKSSTSKQSEERRNVIRQTWMSYKSPPEIPYLAIFVLGQGNNDNTNQGILKESYEYKDILVFEFQDAYDNLTYKTMSSYEWVVTHCKQTKYVLLMDDDTFIDLPQILIDINTFPEFYTDVTVGYCYGPPGTREIRYKSGEDPEGLTPRKYEIQDWQNHVYRKDKTPTYATKYIVPEEEYPFEYFPPYCDGRAHIDPFSRIKKIVNLSPFVQYLRIEDAYLGLIIHCLGGKIRHKDRWGYFGEYYGCPANEEVVDYFWTIFETPVEMFRSHWRQVTAWQFKR